MPEGFLIYTDGACSGNPGPGGWGAVAAGPDARVRELGAGAARTTNNRMELSAVIAALRFIEGQPGPVRLFTDSTYVIGGVTRWMLLWKRNGWARADGEAALNRDLWEELDRLVSARRERISWNYVRGHRGHPANSRCDEIAVAFSRGDAPELYDGPAAGYAVDLAAPAPEPLPAPRPRTGAGGPQRAAWYLSLLEGRLERHASWADCQARVHGRPARFKKVRSEDEERAVLKSWGML